jgi:hypothetical protein
MKSTNLVKLSHHLVVLLQLAPPLVSSHRKDSFPFGYKPTFLGWLDDDGLLLFVRLKRYVLYARGGQREFLSGLFLD